MQNGDRGRAVLYAVLGEGSAAKTFEPERAVAALAATIAIEANEPAS